MATLASLNTIQSLYVAYYGRPADPAGLEYWASLLDQSEGDLSGIINAFGTSSEYTNRFGSNSPSQAVNNLYQQLFGRDAEPEGLEFHVNLITSGQKTLAEIALQISIGAQGGDKTVIEGRTEVANAFTRELDTLEEIEAYSSDRGVSIGQDYLMLVTEQNPAEVVLRDAAPVVETLLPETEPETPPGGGGETSPPALTFTAEFNEDSTVIFGGTQTGDITLTSNEGVWTFTRGALTAMVSSEVVTGIAIGMADLSADARLLDGKLVTGSGQLALSNLTGELDLNGLDVNLTVTVAVNEDLDISENVNLDTVDIYEINNDAQLILTIEQYEGTMIQGQGTLVFADEINTLINTANSGDLLDTATSLVITNPASIGLLKLLDARSDTPFTYSTIRDSAGVIADPTNSDLIANTETIIVIGNIGINDLSVVYATINEATTTVIAENLQDTVDNLLPGGVVDEYVTEGSNVAVLDAATIAEIKLIDVANGSGALTYSLEDSYGHIVAEDAADLVASATAITLESYALGERSVAEMEYLLSLKNVNGDNYFVLGDFTYALLDTSAALSSSVTGVTDIVTGATSVEASDEATVSQARVIYERDNGATYSITDSSSSILGSTEGTTDAVLQAATITATNIVTAAIAVDLYNIRSGTATIYNVSDYYTNITAVAGAAIDKAINLSNYTSLYDIAEAQTLVNFTNSGITSIGYLRDTVADINSFVGANERSELLSYNFYVYDTSSSILTAIDNNALTFITGNPATDFEGDALVGNVQVSDTFDVEGAETFWTTVNPIFVDNSTSTASKTYYVVRDDINNYTNEVAAHPSIIDADLRIIDGTAEDIHQAQRGTLTDNRDIFNLLSGSDYMEVIGSAGNQFIDGGPGSDNINVGADNDTVYAGTGYDTIYGGTGFDHLYGEDSRDTIYAGANAANTTANQNQWWQYNTVVGGQGGDRMYGSTEADIFIYDGSSRDEMIAESSTTTESRDYITNLYLGDKIQFQNAESMQFFSSGSANAYSVEAGTLGLSIRYEKDASVLNWEGNDLESATRIFVDIADENGQFDDIADMHIILVGANIDINWDGSSIVFGG